MPGRVDKGGSSLRVDAVVLAGGLNSGPLRDFAPAKSEALIPIGSRPMVEYVVNALKHTPEVNRIVVAGPLEELRRVFGETGGVILAAGGGSAVETLRRGVEVLLGAGLAGESRPLALVVAADIPLITPEAISDFLRLCGQRPGEIYYPVVSREANERKYPGVKRTYVRLRDGCFTGGNLILVDTRIVERCALLAEEMVRRRKSPVALARLLGFKFLLKFLLRRLTLAEAEAKASELLGASGVAVVSSYAEVGVDVDKPSDLQLARRLLVKEMRI
ncbi:MAG: nucleotidyltransferase family protein [Syntrophomonadaceae bacterium]|nr:nucleotidyltransferase family protein [Syntrophomonadaceae bacterium]